MEKIDEKLWTETLYQENPEVLFVKECVNPIYRATAIGQHFLSQHRLISHKNLLVLIEQHLQTLGLTKTMKILHEESISENKFLFNKDYSQLHFLIQKGIYRVDHFYELFMNLDQQNQTQQEINKILHEMIGSAFETVDDTFKSQEFFQEKFG